MSTALAPATVGLPGIVRPVSLTLPRDLPIKEWARTLRLLGRMGKGIQFWVADALIFGIDHYGEKYAQYVHETGYPEPTLMTMVWVGRAVPASLRMETLTWSHHALVAGLADAEKALWLSRAAEGDAPVSGGPREPWSCRRLRAEIRSTKEGESHDGRGLPQRQDSLTGGGASGDPEHADYAVAAEVWETVASLAASGTPPDGMAIIAKNNAEALRRLAATTKEGESHQPELPGRGRDSMTGGGASGDPEHAECDGTSHHQPRDMWTCDHRNQVGAGDQFVSHTQWPGRPPHCPTCRCRL